MKISYTWLCQLLPGLEKIRAVELASRLTLSGLEVEEILDYGKKFSGIVVGEVLKKDKHPNADKLSLCEVSTGSQKFQVVCGAPNVKAGGRYPFATLGTKMPGGMEIKAVKLRGVDSLGMLCSAKELELEGEDGLLDLPPDAVPGDPAAEALGLNDVIFTLNVTPNRGDALSHWGVARDVAALTGLSIDFTAVVPRSSRLDLERTEKPSAASSPRADLKIAVSSPVACARYTGSQIFGVTVGPSPLWLSRRLEVLGVRSINNVVDATNYIMLLTGHPVHAFDAEKIGGHHIHVYELKAAQKFKTLDGSEQELCPGDLVIADADTPVALAGIMGGEHSEVGNATKDLILEVAYFDPEHIRKTSRRLGLQTESSYRFARFVNPDSVFRAHVLLKKIILALAGGEASEVQDFYPKPFHPQELRLPRREVSRLLGVEVSDIEIKKILTDLACQVQTQGDDFLVTVPLSRSDLGRPVDLVEELARIRGLDTIPTVMPQLKLKSPAESVSSRVEFGIKKFLADQGFLETVHYSFGDPAIQDRVLPDEADQILRLKNPISADLSVMRRSLLPDLLQCYKKNHLKQPRGLRLMEWRTVYLTASDGQPEEKKVLAGLYGGSLWGRNRFALNRDMDFFDGKGLVEALFGRARLDFRVTTDAGWPFHPGQSVGYCVGEKPVVRLGALHPELLQNFKITQRLFYFEIDSDFLAQTQIAAQPVFKPVPVLPPVYRDLALLVPQKICHDDILKAIELDKPSELKHVELFDLYEGDRIPEGKKSLAYALVYEPDAGSLTDDAVNAMHFALVDKLKKRLGVELR